MSVCEYVCVAVRWLAVDWESMCDNKTPVVSVCVNVDNKIEIFTVILIFTSNINIRIKVEY